MPSQVDRPTPLHHSGDFMGTGSKVRFQARHPTYGTTLLKGYHGRELGETEVTSDGQTRLVDFFD